MSSEAYWQKMLPKLVVQPKEDAYERIYNKVLGECYPDQDIPSYEDCLNKLGETYTKQAVSNKKSSLRLVLGGASAVLAASLLLVVGGYSYFSSPEGIATSSSIQQEGFRSTIVGGISELLARFQKEPTEEESSEDSSSSLEEEEINELAELIADESKRQNSTP